MGSTASGLWPVGTSDKERLGIERASSADLAFLAMDTGKVPQQFAVILILDRPGDLGLPQLREIISERIVALPRLRQRLIKVPPGWGRPMWIDDPDFDVNRHVWDMPCRAQGDEPALLETALWVIMTPLPRWAPLWSLVLITELAEDAAAVVVVLHHALADGLGGLNVLAALVDPGATSDVLFPRPTPTPRSLAREAWLSRFEGLRRAAGSWRSLRRGMFASGGLHPARAAPCSLVQPTSPHRQMAVIRLHRAQLAAAAHRNEATANDAVLVAVGGALHQILQAEESPSIPLPSPCRFPVAGLAVDRHSGILSAHCWSTSQLAAALPNVSGKLRRSWLPARRQRVVQHLSPFWVGCSACSRDLGSTAIT